MITAERLRVLLDYDPETGVFTWRERNESEFSPLCSVRAWNKQYPGKRAGNRALNGYTTIRLERTLYYAHRLAWLYMHGDWPEKQIDHINGDRSDNRAVNLRSATTQDNARNAQRRSDNTSGITGVYWDRRKNRWAAGISLGGRFKFLGYFETKDAAAVERKRASDKHGFHENHGRAP